MTELSGHLEDFGLEALIRFLAESGRNGCLKISREAWAAELLLDQGRVVASMGEEHADAALDLIALTLADGEFTYTDALPGAHLAGDADAIPLQQALERIAARSPCAVGSALLSSVPRVAALDAETSQREMTVSRSELAVLLEVNGRRSVEQILTDHRSLQSVHALTRLSELGVIELATPVPGLTPEPTLPSPVSQPPIPRAASSAGTSAPDPRLPIYANELIEASVHANHRPPALQNGKAPRQPTERARKRIARELLWAGLVCVLAVAGTCASVQAVRVDGESMLPGVQPGELLLINRAAYFHVEGSPLEGLAPQSPEGIATRYVFGGPRRGDVVVFQSPSQASDELILRIIALPGDNVRIEQGTVFVDDRALTEPYTVPAADGEIPEDGPSTRVPDGRYFALSDNRAVRQDSRQGWFVRVDDLVGRAWLSFWPPNRWRVFAQAVQPPTPPAASSTSPSSRPESVPTSDPDSVPTLAVAEDTVSTPPSPTPTPPEPPADPGPLPADPGPAPATMLLDGPISNQPGWPSDPAGPVSLNASEYRMTAQAPNNFIAVAAPVVGTYADVIVSATFHKIGGPPGGGYGIIVRDQTPQLHDGVAQTGRFYVAEIGDQGEIGVWRREDDRWVDLLPWTRSEAVHQGGTSNELTVQVQGERLMVLVNGIHQVTLVDAVLPTGGVGAFVGGDYNQVVLDRFAVQVPSPQTTP